MTLKSGTRVGPYEILAAIGAGGMGEVYRAHDTKLGRDVALKTLHEAFASDGERLARFRREAHVLAALNHANIAAIYGLEESTDTIAIILELVDGETGHNGGVGRQKRFLVPVETAGLDGLHLIHNWKP